ncbi:MAG: hypothetical protein Q9226_004519 [Calogaya cf. arnoldii]
MRAGQACRRLCATGERCPQYISNLLMKVNAKLGGATSHVVTEEIKPQKLKMGAVNINPGKAKTPPLPPMFIGADVSHPAPGSHAPSYAAMTVSLDHTATRYAAAVETNKFRVEVIKTRNLQTCLPPLFNKWRIDVGRGRLPKHVYYFRDGVGESQYKKLLATEVADMKQIFRNMNENQARLDGEKPGPEVKFTVVVAEKRHHIRFFPQGGAGDDNGNPLPGTIVERDVTDTLDNDVYLCSHKAIKGTARPTHYTVLMDEAGLTVDSLQKTLYEHCYQYIRSTTSVSLHPAVYYAHLASNRARAHDAGRGNDPPSDKGKGKGPATLSSGASDEDPAPLLSMAKRNEDRDWIGYGMWFI